MFVGSISFFIVFSNACLPAPEINNPTCVPSTVYIGNPKSLLILVTHTFSKFQK